MLEVRYNTKTKEVTGWCGDKNQFGNLKKRWGVEKIAILDIPIPEKTCDAYLFDKITNALVDNPAYTEFSPDYIRASELLATSPDVIKMPEVWELLRIFGRKLGYRKE